MPHFQTLWSCWKKLCSLLLKSVFTDSASRAPVNGAPVKAQIKTTAVCLLSARHSAKCRCEVSCLFLTATSEVLALSSLFYRWGNRRGVSIVHWMPHSKQWSCHSNPGNWIQSTCCEWGYILPPQLMLSLESSKGKTENFLFVLISVTSASQEKKKNRDDHSLCWSPEIVRLVTRGRQSLRHHGSSFFSIWFGKAQPGGKQLQTESFVLV